MRNVTLQYAGIAKAEYQDDATAVCGEWGPITLADSTCLTGQTLCNDTMAECGCTLPGCRASLSLTLVPPPSSPVSITESLYSGSGGQISEHASGEASSGSIGFGSGLDEIGFGSGLDDAPCTGGPVLTFTTVSGACELTSTAYREAWWGGSSPFGYSYDVPIEANDTRLSYAGLMLRSDMSVVYCWGTTKYACESGFASAPFTEDYDWFETSTQICGPDAGINECRRDEWCTIADCCASRQYIHPRHLRSRHPCRHCRRRFRLPRRRFPPWTNSSRDGDHRAAVATRRSYAIRLLCGT